MPKTYKTLESLSETYPLSDAEINALKPVTDQFALSITNDMVALINPLDKKNDPIGDPIARQFIPSIEELNIREDELSDPIGDNSHSPVKGIIHRYPDRLLLTPILLCPIYCRFCFRREKVSKADQSLSPQELDAAFLYIEQTPKIWEVILSGGDPLILSPRRLKAIFERLNQIPHVKIIRIHTRIPILTPEKITPSLLDAFATLKKTLWIVLHTNHPAELTPKAKLAIDRLNSANIPLLSQSVLLKGVNDEAAILKKLFRKLTEWRVKPYYLHQGDLAKGTSHFRTSIEAGQALMRELHPKLSGIAKPTYMLDRPGGAGKIPLTPNYLDF